MVFERYIQSYFGQFTKIIFGTDKIKKIEKVYAAYQIHSGEQILAYIKNTIPFVGLSADGTIITDQALYFDPSHKDWAPFNRIPFTEICGYVLTMESDKSRVSAECVSGSYTLFSQTMLGRNTGGIELIQLIEGLQGQLISEYSWARQQRNDIAAHIIKCARNELKIGRLTAKINRLLDKLVEDPVYTKEALTVKAEDIYRTYDLDQCRQFCEANHLTISENMLQGFESSFRRDLADISNDFDEVFLRDASNNLSQVALLEQQQWTLAYLYARLGNKQGFHTICSTLDGTASSEKMQSLIRFQCCYWNHRMIKVFDAIQAGSELSDSWMTWTDNLGFTPLHYALILRKDDSISRLLEKYNWPTPPTGTDNEIYDYTVLSSFLGLNNCRGIYAQTSQDIATLIRSKKNIERRIWLKERRIDLQEKMLHQFKSAIRTAKKNSVDYEKIEEIQSKIDELLNLHRELEMEVEELRQDIREIESEIQDMINEGISAAKGAAQRFSNKSDILSQYLRRIISDSDFLYRVLNVDPENCTVYTFGDFTFTVPKGVNLDGSSGNTEHKTRDTHSDKAGPSSHEFNYHDTPIVRPYGNSWFSPEAHKKLKALRKEYHLLAKQYHPDLCSHPRSKEIFQEILNERASILETIPAE